MNAAPHYRRPLLETPFHSRTHAMSQVDRFIAWSGYTTVDVFTNLEQEYFAIRNATGVYDLSPMCKYRVSGPQATAYLNRLVTREVVNLSVNSVAYCVWCNDRGHVIDDGTLFRFAESDYRLLSAERGLDWLLDSAMGFDVHIEDVTQDVAALAVQGPTSCAALKACGFSGVDRLKPFMIGAFEVLGHRCHVSRTGFTGDLGYELWMAPDAAEEVWDRLMSEGKSWGIRPIGSQALNLARLEAGFLSPGLDFVSSELSVRSGTERSPLELGLAWQVDFQKGHFNGRRALLAEHRRGPRRRLVGLDVAGDKPASNALLYADANGRHQIGSVTSAAWSPTCKRSIALAMVEAPHFHGGSPVWAEIYLNRELVWERRMSRADIVARPFFSPGRRRAMPPSDT
ncbi:MAG: aminomethyltransferase family protein [Pseudomonadota bacterium]|nr:aminomethyltransferase family protein [Pseudomonadota bacterium]